MFNLSGGGHSFGSQLAAWGSNPAERGVMAKCSVHSAPSQKVGVQILQRGVVLAKCLVHSVPSQKVGVQTLQRGVVMAKCLVHSAPSQKVGVQTLQRGVVMAQVMTPPN